MTCATGKMVCATRQNDVRSWQNDVRAISDVTDVLGKMMCALMCALVCALMCAPVAGVPVAQRISFSSDEQSKVYKVLQPFLWRGGGPSGNLSVCAPRRTIAPISRPLRHGASSGREMLLPYNRAQKKGVWNPTPCARNVASAQAQGHLFLWATSDGQMDHGQVRKLRISRQKPVTWPDTAFGHLTGYAFVGRVGQTLPWPWCVGGRTGSDA